MESFIKKQLKIHRALKKMSAFFDNTLILEDIKRRNAGTAIGKIISQLASRA